MLDQAPQVERGVAPAPRHDSHAGDAPIVSAAQLVEFLREYRKTILTSIAVPVLLALTYIIQAEPIFTARTQMLLDPETPQPLSQPAAVNAVYDSPQIESQVAVINSEKIALTVAESLELLKDEEFGGYEVEEGDSAAQYERAQHVVEGLARSLDVRRVGVSYAIDISFSSADPQKAARVANAFADAFIQDQLAARAAAVRVGSEWLEQRIELIRKQMNASALRVQEFKAKRDYRILGRGVPNAGAENTAGTALLLDPPPAADDKAVPVAPEVQSLEELEATAQTYRRIYESYLQAYTESVQRQSFPLANARIITPATTPLSKSWPRTGLLLALALMLGTLAGFAIALGHRSYNQPH